MTDDICRDLLFIYLLFCYILLNMSNVGQIPRTSASSILSVLTTVMLKQNDEIILGLDSVNLVNLLVAFS